MGFFVLQECAFLVYLRLSITFITKMYLHKVTFQANISFWDIWLSLNEQVILYCLLGKLCVAWPSPWSSFSAHSKVILFSKVYLLAFSWLILADTHLYLCWDDSLTIIQVYQTSCMCTTDICWWVEVEKMLSCVPQHGYCDIPIPDYVWFLIN